MKKGDHVVILTGKDRGKKGKVLEVSHSSDRIVVEGVNQRTKNVRARKQNEKGQRVTFSAPMNASNAMVICPKCSKPTRLGVRREGTVRHRICKKCQQIV